MPSRSLKADALEITSTLDNRVELPCNITPPRTAGDYVTLVLWYKTANAAGPPLYSIDLRSQPAVEQFAAEYKDRAHFNVSGPPTAKLTIDPVRANDTGWFSCRVDYKWSRTTIHNILLTVIGE